MANEQNLIPGAHPLTVEEQSKGGIASAKARREKRDRYQRMQATLAMLVNDPTTLEKLKNAGVNAEGVTYEEAAEMMQAIKAAREGDTNAFKAVKEEAYGKLDSKTQLELSGEVNGITINFKDCTGKDN